MRRVGSGFWISANQTNLDSPAIGSIVNLSWVRGYCEAGPGDNYPHGWEFAFNTSDNSNNPLPGGDIYETTTTPENFSLEKDNVSIQMMQGDGMDVWRNGTQYTNLSLRIVDTDYSNSVVSSGVNGSFWVTVNGTDFANQKVTETDTLGNLT